jgi:hypothetical protein
MEVGDRARRDRGGPTATLRMFRSKPLISFLVAAAVAGLAGAASGRLRSRRPALK